MRRVHLILLEGLDGVENRVTEVSSNNRGVCMVLDTGAVTCLGSFGVPEPVSGLDGVNAVAVDVGLGASHGCAVLDDGGVMVDSSVIIDWFERIAAFASRRNTRTSSLDSAAGFSTAISLLDIPFSRRRWSLSQRLSFLLQNPLALVAFGSTASLLFLVPFIGPILMVPAASVGGLWLVVRLDKSRLRASASNSRVLAIAAGMLPPPNTAGSAKPFTKSTMSSA